LCESESLDEVRSGVWDFLLPPSCDFKIRGQRVVVDRLGGFMLFGYDDWSMEPYESEIVTIDQLTKDIREYVLAQKAPLTYGLDSDVVAELLEEAM
jgi:hypothetical protein